MRKRLPVKLIEFLFYQNNVGKACLSCCLRLFFRNCFYSHCSSFTSMTSPDDQMSSQGASSDVARLDIGAQASADQVDGGNGAE